MFSVLTLILPFAWSFNFYDFGLKQIKGCAKGVALTN